MKATKLASLPTFGLSLAGITFFTILPSPAANIFFSFQTDPDYQASGAAATGIVTAFEGIASGTPTISVEGSGNVDFSNGGAASYTDFQGTTWTGSGDTSGPGSMRWLFETTGNAFTLNFDATGLEDMNVRFDIYSGGNSPLTSFTDLTYDIGGGEVSTGLTLDSFAGNATFNEWTIDLSSVTAIENQSNVSLKWHIPDQATNTALRIDNFALTAVPEPSYFGLLVFSLGAALILKKRRRS